MENNGEERVRRKGRGKMIYKNKEGWVRKRSEIGRERRNDGKIKRRKYLERKRETEKEVKRGEIERDRGGERSRE